MFFFRARIQEICNDQDDEAPARNIISVRCKRARGVSWNRWSAREDFIQWRIVRSLDLLTPSDFCSGGDTFEKCGA